MVSLLNRCANLQDNVLHNSALLVDHGQCLREVADKQHIGRFDPAKATLNVVAVPSPFDFERRRNRLGSKESGSANPRRAPSDHSRCLSRGPFSSVSSQAGEGRERMFVASPAPCSEVSVPSGQLSVDRAQLIEANARRLGLLAGGSRWAASVESEEWASEPDVDDEPPLDEPPPTPMSARPMTPSSVRGSQSARPTSALGAGKICLRPLSAASTAASRPSTPGRPYPWPRQTTPRSPQKTPQPTSRPVSADSMSARCAVLLDTAHKHRRDFKAHRSETLRFRGEVAGELSSRSPPMQPWQPNSRA